MPLPSIATIEGAIGKAAMMDAELYNYLAVTGTHWITREAAYLAAVPADSQPAAQSAQAQLRSLLNSAALMGPARCAPLWATFARVASLPPGEDFWERIFRYFVDNSLTVKYRNITFGSVSAITGSGTGLVKRLTVDQDGFNIESVFAETKTFECVADQVTGARRHAEVFAARGATAGKDSLELIGTGRSTLITAIDAQSSSTLVPNSSFENVTVSSYPTITAIDGWTASSISDLETETTTVYKDNPQAATSRSLRFKTNASITQNFTDLGLRWDKRVPLYAQIAFYRESSCDGNLNIVIGAQTQTVALSAQSGWTILVWKLTSANWYLNWRLASAAVATAAVTISLDSRTTGTLLIDDFLIGPMAPVDGAYVAIVGGATPFLQRDKFTVTDSSADTGIVQTFLARRYGRYLPYTSGSPTWVEPT